MIFYMVSSMNCISYTLVCTLDVCIIFGCWLYTLRYSVMSCMAYDIILTFTIHRTLSFVSIWNVWNKNSVTRSTSWLGFPFLFAHEEKIISCVSSSFFFVTRISHTPRFIPKPHWDWYYFRCCAFVYTYENNILFFVASI